MQTQTELKIEPNVAISQNHCYKQLRVLIACEESQAITKEFRKLGIEAYSCDLLPCSGGHPEWHFQEDIFEVIKREPKFDLMIAHPPCTYLSVAGAWAMYNKDGSINEVRKKNQEDALDFVRALMEVDIKRIAIENPVSVISSQIRKPDQIVHPYHFGDKASKSTCLWLKNLPKLKHTNVVEKGEFKTWIDKKSGKEKRQATWIYDCLQQAQSKEHLRTLRSKTFKGMAEAIAKQWTDFLFKEECSNCL
jgi:site-specific DNA-cytosine methylase